MENTAAPVESQPPAQAEPVVEKSESTPAPEEKPNSSRLLDMARKEAEFAKREVARKEEIAKLQQALRGYEEEIGLYKKAKESYREDPEGLLQKLGITYDELTNSILDYYDRQREGSIPPNAESIRKEIEAQFAAKEAARLEAANKAAVENFSKEIRSFVEANRDNYPHLTQLYKPFGQTETPEEFIFSIVENYFQETNELIDLSTAAATAEEYFREEWNKLNGVLSGKRSPSPTPETKTENKVAPPPQAQPPIASSTLNANAFTRKEALSVGNGVRQGVASVKYRGSNAERNEAIARAVAALEGNSTKK